jgi:foldase protein PrsA
MGCNSSKNTPIVTINDTKLYMEDFLYDIYIVETEGNQLEDYYQNSLGYGYWDIECEGITMREAAKSSIITRVVMNEILADQAKQNEFTLTQKEIMENEEEFDRIIRTSPHSEMELNNIGLTRKVLYASLDKFALGHKYYKELSKSFKIDEKAIRNSLKQVDYREYKTECLFIPTATSKKPTPTPLNEDEVAIALDTITKALVKLQTGSEFISLLNEYDSLAYYTRDFIYGNSIYEMEYQAAAILLENGEYSQVITTNYGYYIIHMLDNLSSKQYERAVEEALELEEEKQFALIYNEIKKQYNISIDFEYWDTITIGSITEPKNK